MKKYLSLFCAAAAMAACTAEQEAPEASIEYAKGQQPEIVADPEGGEIKLGFISAGVWDATTIVNWLELESISGKAGDNVLVVTVDENTDPEGDRTGAVRVMSGNKELVFTITQSLNDKVTAKGETTIELDRQGGAASLEFTATKAWTASTAANWLTLSSTGGEAGNGLIEISAPVNIEADRTAEVKIVCGTYELVYTVSQKYIDGVEAAGNTSFTIPELGGEAELKFSAVTNWTASTAAGWLTLSAESGNAGAEVSIKVSAEVNVDADRTAEVKVAGGKKEIVFTVSQKMATSTLAYVTDGEDAGDVNVYAHNGAGTMDFVAVEAWTASADADWITLSAESGQTGTLSIEVTAADNETLEYRSATVTITSASGKSTLDFTIYQNSAFGDYCGLWTASGTLTAQDVSNPYSEPWLFADSEETPGEGGMKGLLEESKYWGMFSWDAELGRAKIETGPDNVVNFYNFNGIGLAGIAPVYVCKFETSNGPKSIIFHSFTTDTGKNEYPVYCQLSENNENMNLIAFTYDQYPNPTKLVATDDISLTYGLFEPLTDEEGNLTGIGDFMGYSYGGEFKVASVTRETASTTAINAALSTVNKPAGPNARPCSPGGKIRTVTADLVKCEHAHFVK